MSVIAKASPQVKAEKLGSAFWFNEYLATTDNPGFSLFCATLLDVIYESNQAQRLGYPARLTAWKKEIDEKHEIQSDNPAIEKPRRLSLAN